MMEWALNLFQGYLAMCIAASVVMLVVLLLRQLLRKLPKKVICLLWMAVLFRLLCPVAVEGPIPNLWAQKNAGQTGAGNSKETDLETDGKEIKTPDISKALVLDGTAGWLDGSEDTKEKWVRILGSEVKLSQMAGNVEKAQPEEDKNTQLWSLPWKERIQLICGIIILAGIGIFLASGAVHYLVLSRRLRSAIKIDAEANGRAEILECVGIQSPMVFGMIHPRIYIPIGFTGDVEHEDYRLILEHEVAHIRRRDTQVKCLSWIALCIHWWNPLAWFCMALLQRDMEMACDEAVIAHYSPRLVAEGVRKKYANALLRYSMKCSGLIAPAAFGQSNTARRVKNILEYRKRSVAYTVVALCVVGILVVCLVTNPNNRGESHGVLNSDGEGAQWSGMQPEGGNNVLGPGAEGTHTSGVSQSDGENKEDSFGIGDEAPKEFVESVVNVLFADVTHDGVEDAVVSTVVWYGDGTITVEEQLKSPASIIYVRVYDGRDVAEALKKHQLQNRETLFREQYLEQSDAIWESNYAIPHAGNGILILTQREGKEYLMEVSAWRGQGYVYHGYDVFYLDRLGQIYEEEQVEGPSFNFVNETYPVQQILDYTKQISPWMEEGIVVIGFADVSREEQVSLPGQRCTMEAWELWGGIFEEDLTGMEDLEERLRQKVN